MKILVAVIVSTTFLAAQSREVLVSAAASLTDVLQELAPAFQSRYGERLVLNVAASNTLARQIAAGSRVDVFISADEVQMDAVRADIVSDTRVALLSNQLEIGKASQRERVTKQG
jgi:molybdate transport system substrate-binding protein